MVASVGCLPMPLLRHHLARFSAKTLAINSSPIPPQHKPPSGAKSGLAYNIARIGKSPLLCRIRFYAARNGEFSRTKRAPMRHKTELVLKDSSGSLAVD